MEPSASPVAAGFPRLLFRLRIRGIRDCAVRVPSSKEAPAEGTREPALEPEPPLLANGISVDFASKDALELVRRERLDTCTGGSAVAVVVVMVSASGLVLALGPAASRDGELVLAGLPPFLLSFVALEGLLFFEFAPELATGVLAVGRSAAGSEWEDDRVLDFECERDTERVRAGTGDTE